MTRNHSCWRHALVALVLTTTLALAGDRSVTAAEANGTYKKVSSAKPKFTNA
jgi:hypothetical protein